MDDQDLKIVRNSNQHFAYGPESMNFKAQRITALELKFEFDRN